jgi:hypothetical protein
VNKRLIIHIPLVLLLFFVFVFNSCRPEPLASLDATVIILQPSAESILSSSSVTVRTYIDNFKLVDKIGKSNLAGEGHLIYYKDVTPPTIRLISALTSMSTCISSFNNIYTWENVEPGKHIFWVQLVNNDNSCLEPPAAASVTVNVVVN